MGVRRAGKTVLARSVPDSEYLDCELPSVRRRLEDHEAFLAERRDATVVLDEIHRLPDAAQLLKLAADHFPTTRVLATGSSTLGASARFRDTLAGRKREVWLTPMVHADLTAFKHDDLMRRLLRGGLPPFFLADTLPERDFEEWTESYWATDVLARACEVSRPTISTYLAVLDATFVVHVVRPYALSGAAEIVSAPRVYGFDTGFVCHHRGWHQLRRDDYGPLWEHVVLNELHARHGRAPLHYWRTKHGNEIDFVLARRGQPPTAIECKWTADHFEPAGLKAFRNRYRGIATRGQPARPPSSSCQRRSRARDRRAPTRHRRSAARRLQQPVRSRSSAEHDVDAVKNLGKLLGRESPNTLREERPIERDDLRDIHDRLLW